MSRARPAAVAGAAGRAAARGAALVAFASLAACARIEPPPGGPPDQKPPEIVAIHPDSLAVLPGFDGSVEFVFSEVVSEGGSPNQGLGTGDLERLVLLSPTANVPVVKWKRSRITVRPREGWRPNTVYRVELRPGISDVRNNRSPAAAVLTFTTGAPVPTFALHGRVYDWTTGQPARGALVEAVLLPDSLVYRSGTDSTGQLDLGPLPAGRYLVTAIVDANRNQKRDAREPFDTARATPDSGFVPDLWTFVHDTTPPRLQPAQQQDSVTLSVQFTQPLDPAWRPDTAAVRVRQLPDSTRIPVLAVLTPAAADSLQRAARDAAAKAAADSAKAAGRADTARGKPGAVRPDTGRAKPAPPRVDSVLRPPPRLARDSAAMAADAARRRPPLNDRLVVKLGAPLVPGGRYTVEITGARNVTGVAGSPTTGLVVPARPKPTARDSAAAKADSARRAAADSARPPAPPRPR